MIQKVPPFVVLAILDGWGLAPDGPGNAISLGTTTNISKFWRSYPHTELEASGEAVGLPRGEDGNTETGHLNLGAGRIVYQDLQRINVSIADESFFKNKVLLDAFGFAQKNNSSVHLMGLVGAGGVHSNIEHLYALVQMATRLRFSKVFIHVFSDGRDSPPTAAKTYIRNLQVFMDKEGTGKIASIMGRYWAMDRDQRWDRTEKAYRALTEGTGDLVKNPEEAIETSYSEGKTDEFINPALISENGKPLALVKPNDVVIFFNFRIDRPRQLTKAFCFTDFSKAPITYDYDPFRLKYQKTPNTVELVKKEEPFKRGPKLGNLYFVTMTEYDKSLKEEGANIAFPPEVIDMPLSGVLAASGMRQLKVTESEKERFVTFYFNGLREKPYTQEERVIIPSLKVPTYDQRPEMKADDITTTVIDKATNSHYSLILINYPNPDMVGHSGNIGATVKAVEKVDECIGKLANFVLAYGGTLLLTADHGNAEEMINAATGEIDTEHSTYPVPFIAISHSFVGKSGGLRSGILADIAPTILGLLNIPVPTSMTGRNLLKDINLF